EFSRAGRGEPELELVPVAEVVARALEQTRGAVEQAGADVVVHPLPTLMAERSSLCRVFQNLIGNAVKYGRGAGKDVRVRVEWRPVRDAYEFTVADDGPGIAPEYHERAFELFQTLRPRDEVEGSGMGLAVVRKTTESLGGTVRVDSAPGAGAAFSFTWPRTV
ncbi:MAG TPA: ATP-binding protein, partial [Longimicrobium sp.]